MCKDIFLKIWPIFNSTDNWHKTGSGSCFVPSQIVAKGVINLSHNLSHYSIFALLCHGTGLIKCSPYVLLPAAEQNGGEWRRSITCWWGGIKTNLWLFSARAQGTLRNYFLGAHCDITNVITHGWSECDIYRVRANIAINSSPSLNGYWQMLLDLENVHGL